MQTWIENSDSNVGIFINKNNNRPVNNSERAGCSKEHHDHQADSISTIYENKQKKVLLAMLDLKKKSKNRKLKAELLLYNQFVDEYNEIVNNDVKHKFKCVGYANVRFKFCTACWDENKVEMMEKDLYFIDESEGKSARTVLCSECMKAVLFNHQAMS